MKASDEHKLRPLPMLRELRESSGLSQRALAKRSGVAHDTISQIERGERLARSSTAQKLADALGKDPFLLRVSPEQILSLEEYSGTTARVGWESMESFKNEVSDDPELLDAIDWLRTLAIESGDVSAAVTWKEAKAAAGYEDLLEQVDVAYKKLNPPQDTPYEHQLVDVAEATLLLARASAQLIQLVTRELESDAPRDPNENFPEEFAVMLYRDHLSKFASFNQSLLEAWLEGSAATKSFIYITDKALRPLGETALERDHPLGESASESEHENGGGDQEEAATER